MPTDDAETLSRISALEAELQTFKDLREITELMYEYGYSFDDRRMDDFVACFTDDCVGEYLPFAQGFHGKQGIVEFAQAVMSQFPRIVETFHFTVSPVIRIDGDTASGRWHWMNPSWVETEDGQNISAWQFGVYNMEYRRESNGWKISKNSVTYNHVFDVTQGYAGKPMLILGSGSQSQ